MTGPTVTAVVLAYGPEPTLDACLDALAASTDVELDVVLVDNGCTSDAVARSESRPRLQVVRPATNLGFAGGVDVGAEHATGEFLALVNSDAEVRPDALARLAEVAGEPGVGIASGSIRLADRPDVINSVGNPVHFLGLSWAGGFDEPAARHQRRTQVASGSGAGLVLRRTLWEELGGFAPEYFAYLEDTELSLRVWQRGLTVEHVPEAVVLHHYEFSRNALKNYLLERNRLILVGTVYESRTLALLAPALVAAEVAFLAVATVQGWGGAKLRGWWWLLRHRRWLRERRALVQGQRRVPDRDLARLITSRIDPANLPLPAGAGLANALLGAYWSLVRRAL